jgi:2-polyprenyl-3-methyl-5-hydroxy-6-metoxy-1,4-benzoquinol methylase
MTLLEERPLQQLASARESLADEWRARNPKTPDEIAAFYRETEHMGADLDAWHALPSRRRWTEIVVHVAKSIGAKSVIDIGCGAGYELRSLRDAGVPDVRGVEPNWTLAERSRADGFVVQTSIEYIDIATADLLVCLDVLEHLPDPEAFLAEVAGRARLGAVLVEATGTHDLGTPLHLAQNRGWHPGRCLEQHGWKRIAEQGRVRVWQRTKLQAQPRAGALICAYRACSVPTMGSILRLQKAGWDVPPIKTGDGYIPRARGIIVSRWWRETADDVFLMIDDDIVFDPEDADRLVEQCRNGHDVICAAYPIRDGGALAISTLTAEPIRFLPGLAPVEIRYAATGFMAVHRRVIDALVPTLPLCHANQPWSYWPMFGGMVIPEIEPIEHVDLSEDWAFCERARAAGFKIWFDPTIRLGHLAQVELDVMNMSKVFEANQIRLGETYSDDDDASPDLQWLEVPDDETERA